MDRLEIQKRESHGRLFLLLSLMTLLFLFSACATKYVVVDQSGMTFKLKGPLLLESFWKICL